METIYPDFLLKKKSFSFDSWKLEIKNLVKYWIVFSRDCCSNVSMKLNTMLINRIGDIFMKLKDSILYWWFFMRCDSILFMLRRCSQRWNASKMVRKAASSCAYALLVKYLFRIFFSSHVYVWVYGSWLACSLFDTIKGDNFCQLYGFFLQLFLFVIFIWERLLLPVPMHYLLNICFVFSSHHIFMLGSMVHD